MALHNIICLEGKFKKKADNYWVKRKFKLKDIQMMNHTRGCKFNVIRKVVYNNILTHGYR